MHLNKVYGKVTKSKVRNESMDDKNDGYNKILVNQPFNRCAKACSKYDRTDHLIQPISGVINRRIYGASISGLT